MRKHHKFLQSELIASSRKKLYEINDGYGNSLFLFALGWNWKSRAIDSQLARRNETVTCLHALSPKERADFIFFQVLFLNWVASFYNDQREYLVIHRKPCCEKRNRNHELIQSCHNWSQLPPSPTWITKGTLE